MTPNISAFLLTLVSAAARRSYEPPDPASADQLCQGQSLLKKKMTEKERIEMCFLVLFKFIFIYTASVTTQEGNLEQDQTRLGGGGRLLLIGRRGGDTR